MVNNARVASRAGALCRVIIKQCHDSGVANTIKALVRALRRMIHNRAATQEKNLHPFDLRYGTDTSGTIEPWALDIPANMVAHAVRYQTAKVDVFMEILNSLTISYEEFVFVDIGSGKGRALLMASRFPFKEIVGVELSDSLHRIASNNIQIYCDESQRCHRIQSVCKNAIGYEIPREHLVLYLFNPFDEQIMRAVLSNIEKSFDRNPNNLYILYLKPLYRHLFDQSKFLRIIKETDKYAIYERSPAEFFWESYYLK